MKPIFIKSSIYLNHKTFNHPESVDRLISIYKAVEPIEDKLQIVSPQKASIEQILTVHTKEHVDNVKIHSQMQKPLDVDTQTSKDSFNVALYAAGSGILAIDTIKSNKANLAFCAIRPPGHHATPNRAMGFCLFNNIAIAAKYAQNVGYKRVFIVDFDVHHGNGTQDIFYEDNTVFYFSTHQAFTFPGSGDPNEIGKGDGEGFTFNYPLMPNSTDKDILDVYQNELPKLIDNFNPDIILVSAGYDLHESDPLAMLDITFDGIKEIVNIILSQKQDIPKIFFLEGGYNTKALATNVSNTLEAMINHSN